MTKNACVSKVSLNFSKRLTSHRVVDTVMMYGRYMFIV